ncbi:MAG: LacI family DNA-binding transcriptional regulator [Pigmentiphaga sp.]
MSKPANATLQDLAQYLGIHKSTVSRAMDPRRRHLVSADLLQRVEAAALRLGYRPNRAASALSTGRSRTVGILIPDITNPVFPPMVRGIEDALAEEGFFAFLANTSRAEGAANVAVERMLAQQVEGFLVATAVRDDDWLEGLRKTGTPLVLLNRTDGRGRLPAVLSDDMLGMQLAVQHLVSQGHRRIAHLAGPAALSTGLSRRVGFEVAMQQAGAQAVAIAECTAYSVAAGQAGMAQLLRAHSGDGLRGAGPGFTAVVAANDLIALGALAWLKQRRISVPEDVSLIGHNDMPLLEQIDPPLTSVRIQHYEMGFRSARLLLDTLRQVPGSQEATILLRPQLILRKSTAVPRDAIAPRA